MAAAADADDSSAFFEQFKGEYDAFFSEGGNAAPHGGSCDAAAAIESEYELLSNFSNRGHSGLNAARLQVPSGKGPSEIDEGSVAATYALDDGEDDENFDETGVNSCFREDLSPPELPAVPSTFNAADLQLREELARFYLRHRAANLVNINEIVQKYRGRFVSQLWVELARRYRMAAPEVVDLLAGTLYLSSAFEYGQDDAQRKDELLRGLEMESPEERAELLQGLLDTDESRTAGATSEERTALLRMLSFRGLGGTAESEAFRPLVWMVLLGYLPLERRNDWDAILADKRLEYASLRAEVLLVTGNNKLEVKVDGHRSVETCEVLQQILKDVDRARPESDDFRRPATRAALGALLFVYAQRNPESQYVQGMHEVAAVLFHVFSVEPEAAEADTFWCFSALMRDCEANLVPAAESTPGPGGAPPAPSAASASVEQKLRVYEPELARHLQTHGFPTSAFTFRWCGLLFAQEASLPNLVRLWDAFLGDPCRFDFVVCFALAVMLSNREALLCISEPETSAEVLRAAPRRGDLENLLRQAWAICALERRNQTPPFPMRTAKQAFQDLSGWAAPRVQEFGAAAARVLEGQVAPAVKNRAGLAAGTAAKAARGGAQAVKEWLQQDEPIKPDQVLRAQAKVTSLLQAVGAIKTGGVSAASEGPASAAPMDQDPERSSRGNAMAEHGAPCDATAVDTKAAADPTTAAAASVGAATAASDASPGSEGCNGPS